MFGWSLVIFSPVVSAILIFVLIYDWSDRDRLMLVPYDQREKRSIVFDPDGTEPYYEDGRWVYDLRLGSNFSSIEPFQGYGFEAFAYVDGETKNNDLVVYNSPLKGSSSSSGIITFEPLGPVEMLKPIP